MRYQPRAHFCHGASLQLNRTPQPGRVICANGIQWDLHALRSMDKYTCYSSFQHRLKRLLKVRPVADDQSLAYLLILGANSSSRSLSVAAHQEWSQEMRQNMKIYENIFYRLETSIWNAHVYKYLLKNSCLVQLHWPHM